MSILVLFLYFMCFTLVAYKAPWHAHLLIFDGVDENQPVAYGVTKVKVMQAKIGLFAYQSFADVWFLISHSRRWTVRQLLSR